jgi:heptosyltransferase-2
MTIRPDCRHYDGYKPCKHCDKYGNCQDYVPWGRTILIIKLAAIGDVIRTTSLLPGLREKYPDGCITWLTDESAFPLLRANPLIDRLYPFTVDGIASVMAAEYDLLLNFEKEPRALGVGRMCAAKFRKGFAPSRVGSVMHADADSEYALRLGLSDKLKFEESTKTYPQIIYEMASLPYEGQEYVLELTETAADFARRFAEHHGLEDEGTKVVGINTGCGTVFPTKRWTLEGFVELIDELATLPGVKLALLGGQLEVEYNRAILERVGDKIIDTGCGNSMEEFLGLIERCDLVVTADSLAMHLAIGRRKQVVALFGPTSAVEVDLFGRGEKVVSDLPCACCYKKFCEISPNCMESISGSQVAGAVQRCLGETGARGRATDKGMG